MIAKDYLPVIEETTVRSSIELGKNAQFARGGMIADLPRPLYLAFAERDAMICPDGRQAYLQGATVAFYATLTQSIKEGRPFPALDESIGEVLLAPRAERFARASRRLSNYIATTQPELSGELVSDSWRRYAIPGPLEQGRDEMMFMLLHAARDQRRIDKGIASLERSMQETPIETLQPDQPRLYRDRRR